MAAYMSHVKTVKSFSRLCRLSQVFSIPTENLHTCLRRMQRTTNHVRVGSLVAGLRTKHHVLHNHGAICTVLAARYNSSDSSKPAPWDTNPPDVPGYIPEPPPVPEPAQFVEQLNSLGEPTFASMGLGSWWPSGLMQTALEHLHVDLGLPWWSAIVAGTVIIRCAIFPLVILGQRNAANMNNHMPTVQRLQQRFTEARSSGNPLEAARAGQELMDYMKRNNVAPFKNMLVPLTQLPIFLSVFVGLRQCANLPVDSMTQGGLLWFPDLTIPDPLYLMPLITMSTFLVTIELGVDGVKSGSMGQNVKYVMRAMPIIMLPFIIKFPAAMLCYWFTSNAFSLVQVLFLKIPAIRTFFKIPQQIKHDTSALPKKKGFVEGFRDSWSNAKLAGQMAERQRMDALRFKEAGTGPLQKTYTYDPTKVKAKGAVSAKSRS